MPFFHVGGKETHGEINAVVNARQENVLVLTKQNLLLR